MNEEEHCNAATQATPEIRNKKMDNIIKFKTGKTYYCRSVGDHDCVWRYKVIKRTAKTVTLMELNADGTENTHPQNDGGVKRLRIWKQIEQLNPMGSYSMAPILSADSVVKQDPEPDEDSDPIVRALKDAVRKEYAKLRDPEDILEEITGMDKESHIIINNIKQLVRKNISEEEEK